MAVLVVDEQKKPIHGPYVVRLGGWSLERYLKEAPEHLIWEFVRGEVVMHSPATAEHQRLINFLVRLLGGYCEAKGWGEVLTGPAAIRILPDVIREPDIFVLSPEEVPKAKGVPLQARPALIIEVISSPTRTIDLREKTADYASAGIPEYWAVDPEAKEITVHELKRGSYKVERISSGRVESRSVPGFWLEVDWLFQEPLPLAGGCLQQILR